LVYVGFGFLAGPLVLGLMDMEITNLELRVIADLTLALVLFLDAANANLGVLTGYLVFDELGIYEIAVLATMLAATGARGSSGGWLLRRGRNPAVPQTGYEVNLRELRARKSLIRIIPM
jgi:hypothetical protein